MKNKNKTYILLAIVLGIWGTIGYQIFSKLNPGEEPIVAQNNNVSFTPKKDIKKDTFSINTSHRDPFLGTLYNKSKTATASSSKKTVKDTLKWASIVYKGKISKQQSSNSIYILEINGTQQLLKVGKKYEGITLIKGSKKSIVVSFKGKRKSISVAN